MISEISATYLLRRFTSSTEPDFKAALEIYKQNIPPGSRTDTEQIAFWVNNYSKEFGDEFCVCGFYVNNAIVGMAEFAYFTSERLLVFDYLVLHPNYRNHGEFYQFKKMLQHWIDDRGFEFDFATAEVSFQSPGSSPSQNSRDLVKLFMWLGFSVADCVYYQPVLGLQNPQSDMRAHLMISSRVRVSSLSREALLSIVQTIYFQHNERWFVPFISDRKSYRQFLDARFREFEKSLAGKSEIELNGMKLLPESPPPQLRRAQRRPDLLYAFIASVVVSAQCAGLVLLQHFFHLSTELLITVVLLAVLEFVALFALFHKSGRAVLEKLTDLVKLIYNKRK